ncbi:hypothetical protein QBC34DRAFT_377355 [Podospora aff. communis PSN243]|uniref:HD/PDEase domain-containing protein n=1 Tax=Podospora aff. communis PSN243 TaxID=3040156 RepID=A0AAV9GXE7_9PEZI|nr:hypothetical protein QBC34DRAFT_377355 [Podospora aff. communis PSN243]
MDTPELNTFADDPLVQAVTAYVKEYMSKYDASHDWSHILRVVGLARYIYSKSENRADLDLRVIQLAALLHDVGDRKYSSPSTPPSISSLLLTHNCPPPLATKIQTIVHSISYTTETQNPSQTLSILSQHPELGVVQDADRLDALGAIGLGRMFTYGGAKTGRCMDESMQHVDEKLLKLEGMAKTEVGRELMRERTERLRVFQGWWVEERGFALAVGEGEEGSR